MLPDYIASLWGALCPPETKAASVVQGTKLTVELTV